MTDPRLARPLWRGRTNVDALTVAAIEHAERIGGHEFVVTQGSYQAGAGDPNSAGTHDRGGVVDLRWCGHAGCILALRKAGMFAWHRTPAQGPWPDHIHAGVMGHPLLASGAALQQASYQAGRNGLAGNGPDDGPRLSPIPRPVWPPHQEDDMFEPDDRQLLREVHRVVLASREREQATRAKAHEAVRKLDRLLADSEAQPSLAKMLRELRRDVAAIAPDDEDGAA